MTAFDTVLDWQPSEPLQQLLAYGKQLNYLTQESIAISLSLHLFGANNVFLANGVVDFIALVIYMKKNLMAIKDMMIVYRPYVHAITVKLSYFNGKLHVLIIEPKAFNRYKPVWLIVSAIHAIFGKDVIVYESTAKLQDKANIKTCHVHCLFLISQMLKHKNRIFNDLENQGYNIATCCYDNVAYEVRHVDKSKLPHYLLELHEGLDDGISVEKERINYFIELDDFVRQLELSGEFDSAKIWEIVNELSGLHAIDAMIESCGEEIVELVELFYKCTITLSAENISCKIRCKNEDIFYYHNLLLFSNEAFPRNIKKGKVTCLFNIVKEKLDETISVQLDKENFEIIISADSIDKLQRLLAAMLEVDIQRKLYLVKYCRQLVGLKLLWHYISHCIRTIQTTLGKK